MKILRKIKNEIQAFLLPFMLEMPFNQKTTKLVINKADEEDTTADIISLEDQIRFEENAIEYNPQTRKMMQFYYSLNKQPKEAYVIGIAGLKTLMKNKQTLGNKDPNVKRLP